MTEPMTPDPIATSMSISPTVINIIIWLGYVASFILFAVSVIFLIMFIVSKINTSNSSGRNLKVFLILISISAFIGLGSVVLDMMWNACC